MEAASPSLFAQLNRRGVWGLALVGPPQFCSRFLREAGRPVRGLAGGCRVDSGGGIDPGALAWLQVWKGVWDALWKTLPSSSSSQPPRGRGGSGAFAPAAAAPLPGLFAC